MATLEDEIRVLKEKNNELAQKVQYWKLAAATKENEKLELMKEMNDLRLNLVRLKSGGAAQARKLDAALQSNSEKALSHLVQASSAVARTLELAKTYIQDRQDLDNTSHRWSAIGGTPKTDRIHRVPPMMMGGQSIQPVVSLSRTMLNTSNPLSASRNSSQNHIITERAVPMHMLQDVYIPLRRIDASDFPGINMEIEMEANDEEDSAEDVGMEDSQERSRGSEGEDFDASPRLEPVTEDLEPEDEAIIPPRRSRAENPLEGPSWLLDRPTTSRTRPRSYKSRALEADSTTEPDGNALTPPPLSRRPGPEAGVAAAPAFSPTIRRPKRRTSSPLRQPSLSPLAISPAPRGSFAPIATSSRRNSNSGRVLKVLVAKMRLDGDDADAEDVSPPKRPSLSSPARDSSPAKRFMRFDAPSPNGATDSGVIVSDGAMEDRANGAWGEDGVTVSRRDNRHTAHDTRKAQDRGPNVEGRSNRLASTDSPNREENTSHNRLTNDGVEDSGIDNVVDRRGNMRDRRGINRDTFGLAGDSDDSREQNIEDGQNRLSGKCIKDGHNRSDNVGDGRGFVDTQKRRPGSVADGHGSRLGSAGDGHSRFGSIGDSDSSGNEHLNEGRTRRPRKAVTYKEKPLNRKMRR